MGFFLFFKDVSISLIRKDSFFESMTPCFLKIKQKNSNVTSKVECFVKKNSIFDCVFNLSLEVDTKIENREIVPVIFRSNEEEFPLYLKVASIAEILSLSVEDMDSLIEGQSPETLLAAVVQLIFFTSFQEITKGRTARPELQKWMDCLDEMTVLAKNPSKEAFICIQNFIKEKGFQHSSSREEVLSILRREKRKAACMAFGTQQNLSSKDLDRMATLSTAWQKRKEFEEKIQKLAIRLLCSGKMKINGAQAREVVRVVCGYRRGKFTYEPALSVLCGRLDSGEVIIGNYAQLIGKGSFITAYAVHNYLAKKADRFKFVFKLQNDPKENSLSQEDKILKLVHEKETSPYIASPLVGRVFHGNSTIIEAALQEREGQDLFGLLERREITRCPEINVFWNGLRKARLCLREKNLGNLDCKFENMVLSLDKERIKLIDFGGVFSLKKTPDHFPIFSPPYTPQEGIDWLSTLIKILSILDEKEVSDSDWDLLEKIPALIRKEKITEKMTIEEKREFYRELILEEYQNTVARIEDFQDGLLLKGYAEGNPYPQAYGFIDSWIKGQRLQVVTDEQGRALAFKYSEDLDRVPDHIKADILFCLDPDPFVEMLRKAAGFRFEALKMQMIADLNSSQEDKALLIQEFIQNSWANASETLPSKQESLVFLQGKEWQNLSFEQMQNLTIRWEESKTLEGKLEELAARVQKTTQTSLAIAKMHVKDAHSYKKGTIFRSENTVVGRLESGDLLVGIRDPNLLSYGGNVEVYSVTNLIARVETVAHFVLKIQTDPAKANLLQEDRLLKVIHAETKVPYIASPLAGRVWDFSEKKILEALQEREGLDLFTLACNKGPLVPGAELVLESLQEARKKLREKGVVHLDNKLENMVLSWDRTVVKMIDFDKSFLKGPIPEIFGGTPHTCSIEARLWLGVLSTARCLLAQGARTEEENKWIAKVQTKCPSGIEQEFYDTAEKMEDFQDGFLLWRYVSLLNGGNPLEVPYKKETSNEKKHQRIVDDEGKAFPFLQPKGFKNESQKIQDVIVKYLNPEPFIEMHQKYKTYTHS